MTEQVPAFIEWALGCFLVCACVLFIVMAYVILRDLL